MKPLAEAGKTVAFLTIGDPTVYSTVGYILKLAEADGIPTELVNGVPSFCCAAAACGTVLAEGQEDIHILSGFNPDKLALPGTKIIMKSGRKAAELKKDLLALEERAGSKVFAASDAVLDRVVLMLDTSRTLQDLRAASAALLNIKEVQMIRSALDQEEQLARIEKLQAEIRLQEREAQPKRQEPLEVVFIGRTEQASR